MRENRRIRKKKKERLNNRMALMGVTLAAVHLKGIELRQKDEDYRYREEELAARVAAEEARAEELEEYRIYVQTKEYIEKVAKEKLGLVNKDEILLKPSEKK